MTVMERPFDFRTLEEAARLDREVLADRLGVTYGTVAHLRRMGLTEDQADLYACRLGFHPGCVWPDWFAESDPHVASLFVDLWAQLRGVHG